MRARSAPSPDETALPFRIQFMYLPSRETALGGSAWEEETMSKSQTARPVLALSAAVAVVGAALMTARAPRRPMPEPSPTHSEEDRARRVCRTITPTSSRLVRRVCRPQHEWDEEMKASQTAC